ncbi:MAG: VRR-NUC domain-containing protein [Acidaminococcaceae bacterium]|nr:VRR-NUC domain-containing protein [Acidaminococcaceae bacterium]
MAKTQTETYIRRSIKDALTFAGWDVTTHLQGVGCRRGFPDLTAMKDGRTIYIEVKTATGRQSDYQKEFQKVCEAHGCKYILARSVNDIAEFLTFRPLF